ncbi:hypothetical protein C0995_002023 [Termitomyces sp. Mi166|nr:hypothetical protein C0995_002023 [Termitomyces sp. Mi166\
MLFESLSLSINVESPLAFHVSTLLICGNSAHEARAQLDLEVDLYITDARPYCLHPSFQMTPQEREPFYEMGIFTFNRLWPFAIAILLLVGFLALVVSAVHCFALFYEIVIELDYIANATETLKTYNDTSYKVYIIWLWSSRILPLLIDTLITWRVRIAFSRVRWMVYVLSFVWIITLVTTLCPLGLLSSATFAQSVNSTRNPAEAAINVIFTLGMVFSLILNAITTSSVVWLFWRHRKLLRLNYMHVATQRMNLRRLILLLVDSGAIYCGLQFITTIFNAFNFSDSPTAAANILSGVFLSSLAIISGMYPNIIALLLNRSSFLLDTIKETAESPSNEQTRGTMPIFTSVPPMESIELSSVRDAPQQSTMV